MTGVQIRLMLATSCFLLASARPSYKFAYGVHDPNTKDVKEHQEYKDDDNRLHGYYKTLDSDGLMRTVTYKFDPSTGFEAHVDRVPYDNNAAAAAAVPISRSAGYAESPYSPMAWSTSMMHRIDPAAPIVVRQQDPGRIEYEGPFEQQPTPQKAAPIIRHGFIETKTASAVIHPTAAYATPAGSLQSQYSYGQPSGYDRSYANAPIVQQRYGYPAEHGDPQSYSAMTHHSYTPGY